ncbi:kirola-like [Olea europaea var. sylvestris]|uniref:kirola-like n=1 Tax=Olea europaea var. sylvestris TaxID=158386 RepID=UPI000C1D0323|nr:kirola-like [Olea europaea var. sylvestris]
MVRNHMTVVLQHTICFFFQEFINMNSFLQATTLFRIDIASLTFKFLTLEEIEENYIAYFVGQKGDSQMETSSGRGDGDGKPQIAEEVIEAIDEEKRSVTFKLIEGDLQEVLKDFKVSFHVETDGDTDLITWTLEYKKLNDDVEDPLTLLGLCIKLAKDIESHHLKAP